MLHSRKRGERKKKRRGATEGSGEQKTGIRRKEQVYRFAQKRNLVLAWKDCYEAGETNMATDGELLLCYPTAKVFFQKEELKVEQ